MSQLKVDSSTKNFTVIGAGVGVWGPKTENFTKILTYKRPAGAYPFSDFYHIFTVCGQHHVRSRINIWADSLKGFRSYGGLGLVVCALPQIFSDP